MNLKVKSVLCVFAIAAVVVTSSCSAVTTTLEGIVDGATALEPIVAADAAAGQMPASTAALVMNYLEATSTAAANSVTEWESSDSDQVKIAAISANFAAVTAPVLGAGMSSVVVTSIDSISNLVVELMAQIKGATVGATSAASANLKVSIVTKYKLNRAKTKAGKNVAAIEAWKAQQAKAAAK